MMLYLLSGSPTAELFAASYNNTGKSNTITLNLGSYGYTNYNNGSNWSKPEDNHGIYNKSTSINWWLASPYNGSGSTELLVDGSKGCLGYNFVDSYLCAVRPIVCIPASVFNNKYATDTILVDE